jgi:hypothetical protein
MDLIGPQLLTVKHLAILAVIVIVILGTRALRARLWRE